MSIQSINQTISSTIETAQTDTTSAISFTDKALDLASHLFVVGKETLLDHPWVSLATAVAVGVGFYFLVYAKKIPLPSIDELVERTEPLLNQSRSRPIVLGAIKEFVGKVYQSTDFRTQLQPAGLGQRLQDFLTEKIHKIIEGEANPISKKEMIHNAIVNFSETISTARVRVNTDISEGKLLGLGVDAQNTIAEIRPLGDETHHGGKIPLRIVLTSGLSIVYKPRSMMPEKLICDSNEGVLRHEGFGTYHVVCHTDASGDYGYSDFVQNIQDENTVSTPEEGEQYVRKMCLLEEVSSRLGLSDLHYMNIITDHRNPCIIDAEVFLNPPGTESGIMNEVNGALHVFDIMKGNDQKFVGKNKIWFHPDLTMGKECDFRFRMSKDDLAKIKIDVEQIKATTQLSQETEAAILQAKGRLQELNGRFVLADTQEFTGLQPRLDHRNQGGIDTFINCIRVWIDKGQGYIFNEDAVVLIQEGAKKDIRNHDVPAFYYDSNKDKILYHGIVVGVQKASS